MRLNEENKVINSDSTILKNKKEIDKIKETIDKLTLEWNSQKKSNEMIISFIESKRSTLLGEVPKNNISDISRYLIQVNKL